MTNSMIGKNIYHTVSPSKWLFTFARYNGLYKYNCQRLYHLGIISSPSFIDYGNLITWLSQLPDSIWNVEGKIPMHSSYFHFLIATHRGTLSQDVLEILSIIEKALYWRESLVTLNRLYPSHKDGFEASSSIYSSIIKTYGSPINRVVVDLVQDADATVIELPIGKQLHDHLLKTLGVQPNPNRAEGYFSSSLTLEEERDNFFVITHPSTYLEGEYSETLRIYNNSLPEGTSWFKTFVNKFSFYHSSILKDMISEHDAIAFSHTSVFKVEHSSKLFALGSFGYDMAANSSLPLEYLLAGFSGEFIDSSQESILVDPTGEYYLKDAFLGSLDPKLSRFMDDMLTDTRSSIKVKTNIFQTGSLEHTIFNTVMRFKTQSLDSLIYEFDGEYTSDDFFTAIERVSNYLEQ